MVSEGGKREKEGREIESSYHAAELRPWTIEAGMQPISLADKR